MLDHSSDLRKREQLGDFEGLFFGSFTPIAAFLSPDAIKLPWACSQPCAGDAEARKLLARSSTQDPSMSASA